MFGGDGILRSPSPPSTPSSRGGARSKAQRVTIARADQLDQGTGLMGHNDAIIRTRSREAQVTTYSTARWPRCCWTWHRQAKVAAATTAPLKADLTAAGAASGSTWPISAARARGR